MTDRPDPPTAALIVGGRLPITAAIAEQAAVEADLVDRAFDALADHYARLTLPSAPPPNRAQRRAAAKRSRRA